MSATFIMSAAEAYVRQAIAELRERDHRLGGQAALAPGVIRFTASVGRSEFLERIRIQEPIFVRHIHPVDLRVNLDGRPLDLDRLAAESGALVSGLKPGVAVAVQVRRVSGAESYDRANVRASLDAVVEAAGGRTVTQAADWILSCTLDQEGTSLGLSTPAENLSDWPGGEVRYRREEEQLSRAKFKLLEAFAKFGVTVQADEQALDLGAAPGGWTSLLLEKGMQVTAVDTGRLSSTLAGHPGLTFRCQNAEEVSFPPESFDLITCDMSWNPLHTARMVTRLAPSAKPGANLILTVKLMLQNPNRTIRLVAEVLAAKYQLMKVKQLFHNRDEVTMHLRAHQN